MSDPDSDVDGRGDAVAFVGLACAAVVAGMLVGPAIDFGDERGGFAWIPSYILIFSVAGFAILSAAALRRVGIALWNGYATRMHLNDVERIELERLFAAVLITGAVIAMMLLLMIRR